MRGSVVVCVVLFALCGYLWPVAGQASTAEQGEIYYARANAFLDKEDWQQAIENYLLAIKHSPQNPNYHMSLAYVYYKTGQRDQVIHAYQTALPLVPADQQATLLYNLGVVYFENNQATEAIQAFQQALTLQPDLVDAHHNLGAIRFHQKQLKEALYHYQKAHQLAPEDIAILQDLNTVQALLTHPQPEFAYSSIGPDFSKSGLSGGLRLGTTPLSLGSDQGDFKKQIFWWIPHLQLNLEYEFGRWMGISDLSGLFTVGVNQPVQYGAVPNVSVLSFDLETGITKQWRWTPWILNVTLKGGLLVGALLGAANLPDYLYGDTTTPTQGLWGLTPMVGLYYQLAPNMEVGLNAGWRFYWGDSATNQWEYQQRSHSSQLRVSGFPNLGSFGPILQIIGNYGF